VGSSTYPEERIEWVVPLPHPRSEIADATHFRSTWLTASRATLTERGYGAKYEANLDPMLREAVLSAVPGIWLPMNVAYAHYEACDRLEIGTEELLEIGRAATRRANPTTLSVASRLAQGVGVTPWTMLEQLDRFFVRTSQGGAIGVARLGPKEARVEVHGFPLCALRYNRITMRGILGAFVEFFCTKSYAKEVSSITSARRIAYRLSWA
jgi:hypothetical protein